MITEFFTFDKNQTVDDVVRYLRENAREYENYNVQYIYVTSGDAFVGVLRMRDLLLSDSNTMLASIVLRDAYTVSDGAPIDELISFFDKYDFYGVPVLNETNQMVGVVLRKHILEAENEKASR